MACRLHVTTTSVPAAAPTKRLHFFVVEASSIHVMLSISTAKFSSVSMSD